jgi:hypothetical protein
MIARDKAINYFSESGNYNGDRFKMLDMWPVI